MTKREFARLGMYDRLIEFLTEHATTVDTLPSFRAATDRFIAHVAVLKTSTEGEWIVTEGITRGKENERTSLAKELFSLCSAVSSYAAATGNAPLNGDVSIPEHVFLHFGSTQLVQAARRVLSLVAPHVASLADYGVLPADLAALTASVGAFEEHKEDPRTAITDRKKAGATTDARFSAADYELDSHLDKLIHRFNKTTPEFVQGYSGARFVVDPATLPTRLILDVSALRGGPIQGATVTVNGTDLTGITDSHGHCTITGIRPGTWSVSFAHGSYKTGTLGDIVTKLGKTIRVKAELEEMS
jgi:hypothetical protein